jgi:hypothetical protein
MATVKTTTREVPGPPVREKCVELTLSMEEASALFEVTWHVGGPPEGPRGVISGNKASLWEALDKAGVQRIGARSVEGHLSFRPS